MKTRNTEELLKRIRRGTTDTFSVQDWLACLDVIGWLWTKTVILPEPDYRRRETQYTIKAPDGEIFLLKKEPGYRVITFYEFRRWALQHGLQAAVDAVLGPAAAKPSRDDLENTGTCACCFGTYKLKLAGGTLFMTLHGYRRPGVGYVIGNCPGINFEPFELSAVGTQYMLSRVRDFLKATELELSLWTQNPPEEVTAENWRGETVRYLRAASPYDWGRVVDTKKMRLGADIKQAQADMARLEKKIADWSPTALPGAVTLNLRPVISSAWRRWRLTDARGQG